jgi:hypothetical protein
MMNRRMVKGNIEDDRVYLLWCGTIASLNLIVRIVMFIQLASLLNLFFSTIEGSGFPYLDPGSGSYLIQLLLAGLLGAGLTIRMFWGRIKSFFKRENPIIEDSGDE